MEVEAGLRLSLADEFDETVRPRIEAGGAHAVRALLLERHDVPRAVGQHLGQVGPATLDRIRPHGRVPQRVFAVHPVVAEGLPANGEDREVELDARGRREARQLGLERLRVAVADREHAQRLRLDGADRGQAQREDGNEMLHVGFLISA